ncbi:hypothetical protein I7636_02400 [Mycoplasma mycoides subsp. capri]|uniref:hypothetical protein n=1 Tax=Mycoplasma mycoides TaxID=2102 RepID=UPI00223FC290|nr:hypothetical protein [Mycoplasma mycoides]QVK01585.1 hypothetical protein I7636_02400 [Mycoplasma mycoides subsp. capri]
MEKDILLSKIYGWMAVVFILLFAALAITAIKFEKFENALIFWILGGVSCFIAMILTILYCAKCNEIKRKYT